MQKEGLHYKDDALSELAERGNVAQFIGFDNQLNLRRSRVVGYQPDAKIGDLRWCALMLLRAAGEKSVNVRCYRPDDPKSRPFHYGLRSADEIEQIGKRMALDEGFHIILNETIDINDGGVSGVSCGGLVEFAPQDTPRCVEKGGTLQLAYADAMELFQLVYGFTPDLDAFGPNQRVEFSIHPQLRGVHQTQTLLWEIEEFDEALIGAKTAWPNRFSKFIGDKAFGLLMAHIGGAAVPKTLVVSRGIAPFKFGTTTGYQDQWVRTAPRVPEPGLYTTKHGHIDPFELLADEDAEGHKIASVLFQHGIKAEYSGVCATTDKGFAMQGVKGFGDSFMLGDAEPVELPTAVTGKVLEVLAHLEDKHQAVRFEWVYDGSIVWVVQLHQGKVAHSLQTIFPGEPVSHWIQFDAEQGIDNLRELVKTITFDGHGRALIGVEIIGNVGVLSHIGDVLRKAEIPSRIVGRD